MTITVNGEPRDVTEGSSLADLVTALGLTEIRLALELNCQVVPRATFEESTLNDGDAVEIVTLVGGG